MPCISAVAAATAIPPSTHIAWQTHAFCHGISSFSVSTFSPNNTHGHNIPLQPAPHQNQSLDSQYDIINFEHKLYQQQSYNSGYLEDNHKCQWSNLHRLVADSFPVAAAHTPHIYEQSTVCCKSLYINIQHTTSIVDIQQKKKRKGDLRHLNRLIQLSRGDILQWRLIFCQSHIP